MTGYFGIGVYRPKTRENIGTLWRSAYQLGASFIFTVGARYKKQPSDTLKTFRHIPLLQIASIDQLNVYDCPIVGIETEGEPITAYQHPQRCVYLLGSEDDGLSAEAIRKCRDIISIPAVRTESFNVAVAGSLAMFDRVQKERAE
jgi:tRNA G18 (ribose-2'-O)-methylase SpoU